jgi:hypothetical protein
MKNKTFLTLLIILILIYAVPLCADWHEEEQKIDFLIEQVGLVDGYFVRNGNDHSPESAVAHLNMKMEKAMNSWFAPDKDKWTVEMFIEKIASKSSFSGKPYQIRFKSGQIVYTGDWFHERLKEFSANGKRGNE